MSLTKSSDPNNSAPEFFASGILLSSHKTAILIFFPLPFGKLTIVLKLYSSFLCFKFRDRDTSIDSSNFVVQFFLTLVITSPITEAFLSLFSSKSF